MNSFQNNFIFLSQLIHISVIEAGSNRKIGKILDLTAGSKDMYPKVTGLIVGKSIFDKHKQFIPWKNVKRLVESKTIYLQTPEGVPFGEDFNFGNDFLLKENLWDQQIVDISGSKVVRVNDLHLLREDNNLWLVHVDVGLLGLFRRLSVDRILFNIVMWLTSYEMKDKLISWKFVQPTTTDNGAGVISLKTQTKLTELHPADLADIIADLGTDEMSAILLSLDNAMAARTYEELPLKIRLQIAGLLKLEKLISIFNEMATDEAVDVLYELPKKKSNLILSQLPEEKAEKIKNLLGHSKRIAGSLMNTEFIALRQTTSSAAVLDIVKKESKKKESIYYIYALDENDCLSGMVTLRQVLTAPPEKTLAELSRKRVVKVNVSTDIRDVAETFYKYNFTVVPVVDDLNKIQGIITMKDAFESVFHEIREETEEE